MTAANTDGTTQGRPACHLPQGHRPIRSGSFCKLTKQVAIRRTFAHIDNGERADGFKGCDYGRILVFEDNTGPRCDEHNYAYAYRPDAYLFATSNSIKGCIEDEWYDLSRIH